MNRIPLLSKKINILQLFSLAFSFFCHTIAIVQYIIRLNLLYVNQYWTYGFIFIIGFSFVLSVILFFNILKRIKFFILILKFIFFVILGYPLGEYLGVEFTLLTILIIEIGIHIRLPKNIFFLLPVIGYALIMQKPAMIWGKVLPGASIHDILSLGLYSSILTLIICSLNYYYNKSINERKTSLKLNETILQLTSANVGFQQYAATAEELSKLNERKRITREIHDTIGYTLTNLIMMMEAALDLSKSGSQKLQQLLIQARDQAKEGLRETRSALHILRAVEFKRQTGVRALYKLIKNFERATGLKVELEYGNLSLFSFALETHSIIYRIIQEGMTNAFRHGKATEIKIYCWLNDTGIRISVHDNGEGCDEIKEGIGLMGMRERLEYLGGFLKAGNVIDGFELIGLVPLLEKAKKCVNYD